MIRNISFGVAILVFLLTFVWVINNRVKGVGTILGVTFLTAIGYLIIAIGVIAAIIAIIKWSANKLE